MRGRYLISNSAVPWDPEQALKKSGSHTARAELPLLDSNQDSPEPAADNLQHRGNIRDQDRDQPHSPDRDPALPS